MTTLDKRLKRKKIVQPADLQNSENDYDMTSDNFQLDKTSDKQWE